MQLGALSPYEDSLLDRRPIAMRHHDGRRWSLDVRRWLADVDAADLSVVDRTIGPMLDVGCGPGRIVEAATRRGAFALGIDIAPVAVELTRARGMNALHCDVFGPVPGRGRWNSIVLIDGNIGIGGSPLRLLARTRELLGAGGAVLVETDADDAVDERMVLHFDRDGADTADEFPWAHVGATALRRYAELAGLQVTEQWSTAGRRFAALTHPVQAAH